MPLRALLDGKDFYSDDLTEAHRKNAFFCPICKMHFIIVLPIQGKIKHFRHPIGGASHYEPETEEHLNGKKVLMEISRKLGLIAQTEVMIGNHVTDVLIEGSQPLAIEFQCSKCNSKEISDRVETYSKNGIATLWILGKNFAADFQKKIRTNIEREIEKLHPTIYFTEGKFIVCRRNPKYYSYFESYSFTIEEKPRLVENFDIDWHLKNFVSTKLTEDNLTLIFRWMIPEKPNQEELSGKNRIAEPPEKNGKNIETPFETRTEKDAHYQPRFRPRYRPPNYEPPPTKISQIQSSGPTW
jgi:hypothetical protein